MHIEFQKTMQQLAAAQVSGLGDVAKEVSDFTPIDFRVGVQWLVAQNNPHLAQALAEAGLSLYPDSEDILAITGLLALMRQEWSLAVELMDQLRDVQNDKTPPFTYVMLVRALRCNLDPVRALEVVNQGLAKYPDQVELAAEKLILKDFSTASSVQETSEH